MRPSRYRHAAARAHRYPTANTAPAADGYANTAAHSYASTAAHCHASTAAYRYTAANIAAAAYR